MRIFELRWLLPTLLMGCPAGSICVVATDTSAARLQISLAEGRDCDETPVMVKSVSVRRTAEEAPIWSFSSSSGQPLSSFVYGELPEGFSSGVESSPLAVGETVRVAVSGVGTDGFLDVQIRP